MSSSNLLYFFEWFANCKLFRLHVLSQSSHPALSSLTDQITAAFNGRDGRGVVRCGRSVSPPLIQPRSIWRPYCIAMFGVISYHIYCFLLWPYRAITTGTNTCTRHWYVLTVWSLCGNADSRHAKRDKHKALFVSFIVVVVLVTTHELHMKNIISMHEVLIGKRH